VTILLAVAIVVAGIMILAIYLLHNSIRQTLKPDDLKPGRVRVDDETAFTIATMQAVITELKAAERMTQEKLSRAEQRADQNARKTDLIAREIDQAMIIFDGLGFLAHASARVREVLAIDTWSRRRYPAVLEFAPKLVAMVEACLATGAETRSATVEFQGPDNAARKILVSVLPVRDRSGTTEAVVCLFREVVSVGQ
jgi:PAS domain-containing protein